MTADRKRQLAAAHAMTDLIARDLPAAYWKLTPHATELDVHLVYDTDDEMRAAVAEWAHFFGAKVVVNECEDYTGHDVTAEHMGVPVRVWGQTDRTYTYKKVPADPQPDPQPISPARGSESGGLDAPSSSSQEDGATGAPPSAVPVAEGGDAGEVAS